jgi:VIT1/CCC1 family predicted Fe2+/Mn2+ transporter
MGSLAEKTREARLLHALHQTTDPQRARQLVAGALPPAIAQVLQASEYESVQQRLQRLPEPPARAGLQRSDWRGATAIFLVVFLSTFPVALPFVFVHDAALGKRISNAVAIVMLFGAGAIYGRCIGRSPWLVGIAMFLLGGVLAGLTMALGG